MVTHYKHAVFLNPRSEIRSGSTLTHTQM